MFNRQITLVFIVALNILVSSYSLAETKIKIGVSVPLTGNAASYGNDVKNGLIFANQYLGNSKYELVIEDDQCNNKEAVVVAQKFVSAGIKYVLGFGCSGSILAAAPVYEANKILVIASGTGAPAITNAGDYIFRTKPSLIIAAEKLATNNAQKYKKVGVITEETAYCTGLTSEFIKASQLKGLEVIGENFLPGTTDFRSILLRLKSKKIESLFLNTQDEVGLATVYKQLLDMNFKISVYGNFHPGSPVFLNEFRVQADGIIFADSPFNADQLNERGLKIYGQYEKDFGPAKSGEHFITLSYLAFSTLDEALNSGLDPKTYLYEHSFQGIVDGYSFDKNGDIVSDKVTYVLKTIKDGKPARLD
jgi:branched-chain amino acid transport system substrate-binding protein